MTGTWAASFHTHSSFCDGRGSIYEMVEAAVAVGLETIGISSHMPLPFSTDWTMQPDRLHEYVAEVQEVKRLYGGRIRVLLGGEIDFIPDQQVIAFQQREVEAFPFDYFVGSVHFLGSGYPPPSFDGDQAEFARILNDEYADDIRAMVADYYRRVREMLHMDRVRIVGHLDVIKRWNAGHTYFRGDEPWYVEVVEETLQAIARSGRVVELNTAGWHKGLGEPYPSPAILRRCGELHLPLLLSSDAHAPDEVTRSFDEAQTLLRELGLSTVDLDDMLKKREE